jgi:uncharacterized membrane protein
MDKTRQVMRSARMLVAAGLGATLMYFLDPGQGRRRKAVLRDRAMHFGRATRDLVDGGLRDLSNRAAGFAAQVQGALRFSSVSDAVLVERVRARLGRVVSHPHAVEVEAQDGQVTLSGPVLRSEALRLLRAANSVRGVCGVTSRLDVHDESGRTPALQGGRERPGPRGAFRQEHWAPGPRLLVFFGGALLAWYGRRRRDTPGMLASLAGAGLAARAVADRDLGRTLGLAAGRRGIDVHKTIHISAPRARVFEAWSGYENFPRFMSMVEQVRALDDTRSHWVVKGPLGTLLEWDSTLTDKVAPALLAWRSDPGATVEHGGIVQFDDENGGTRVTVRLSYHPPAGAVGHTVASLLGRDPRQAIEADLARMKTFVERGDPPRDAAAPAAATEHRRPPSEPMH